MMRIVPTLNLVKASDRGGPLSPLLFNLVIDVFTRMLMKDVRKEYITGFMSNLCPGV
jgi:hypothetical protein